MWMELGIESVVGVGFGVGFGAGFGAGFGVVVWCSSLELGFGVWSLIWSLVWSWVWSFVVGLGSNRVRHICLGLGGFSNAEFFQVRKNSALLLVVTTGFVDSVL